MKNKEKHPGGRPPKYDRNDPKKVQELAEKCDAYFESIKGSVDGDEVILPEPPTITGLALALNFNSKDTLYQYAKIDEFSDSIKRAIMMVEQYHEIKAAYGDKCTGNIFILKNFGWKDKTEQDITMKQDIVWHEEKTYETKDEDGS